MPFLQPVPVQQSQISGGRRGKINFLHINQMTLWRLQRPLGEYYRRLMIRLVGYQKRPLQMLVIDITNRCNLKCPVCGAAHCLSNSSRGDMPWEMFLKIVDEAEKLKPKYICLYAHGEPLLHDRLLDMVTVLSERGLFSEIVTNAEILTTEYSLKLIAAGLSRLIISYPGISDLNYSISRGTNIPGGLEERIIDAVKVWAGTGRQVILRCLAVEDKRVPRKEIIGFEKKWRAVDGIFDIEIHGYLPWPRHYREDLMKRITAWRRRCEVGFDTLCVLRNGIITPCSYDVLGELALGTFPETSLTEAYNGRLLRRIRRAWYRKKLTWPEICAACLIPRCAMPQKKTVLPDKNMETAIASPIEVERSHIKIDMD